MQSFDGVGRIIIRIWNPPTQPVLRAGECHQGFLKYDILLPYKTRELYWKDKIQIFRSGILISISVLGDEKRKLPFFCLHAFSRDPLDVSGRFIYRWKDIFKGNTAQLESWETVQWGRSYSRNKFDDYGP